MDTQVKSQVTDPFPKAAPGCGAILYRRGPTANSLYVGCASRSYRVGKGFGISFGGFVKVIDVLKKPIGGVLLAEAEAYREGLEELPGLGKILPRAEFYDRSQYLTGFTVHTPDANKAHQCTFFGCPVAADEQAAISKLRPSRETTGPLEFYILSWQPGNPGRITLKTPSPLFHKHEKRAFKALAQLAARGKLEYME